MVEKIIIGLLIVALVGVVIRYISYRIKAKDMLDKAQLMLEVSERAKDEAKESYRRLLNQEAKMNEIIRAFDYTEELTPIVYMLFCAVAFSYHPYTDGNVLLESICKSVDYVLENEHDPNRKHNCQLILRAHSMLPNKLKNNNGRLNMRVVYNILNEELNKELIA